MAAEVQKSLPERFRELSLADSEEAGLLWDEYKYRHDLIWRHLIRSTLALVGLVTVGFAKDFADYRGLITIAVVAALVYWAITAVAIDRELHLYNQIKAWHRFRQYHFLGLHKQSAGEKPATVSQDRGLGRIYYEVGGFPRRVGVYLLLLLIGLLVVGFYELANLPSP